jgi:tetratricopeptide (TPR) repeat protein
MLISAEFGKGAVYFERGEFGLSQKYYERGLELFLNNGGDQAYAKTFSDYILGWIDLKDGRIESAKTRLEVIKSNLPDILEQDLKEKMEYLFKIMDGEVAILEGGDNLDSIVRNFEDYPPFLSHFVDDLWTLPWVIDYVHYPPPFVRDIVPRAYIQKGELDKAIAAYERLITFNPQGKDRRLIHPLNHYRLAKLYEQKSDKNKAVKQYRKFLNLWKDADPGIAEVEDARKRLAGLKGQ